MKQYSLTIQDIRKETKDAITLCFKQPSFNKIRYQAGQYITLIVRINGRKYARPYSLSSAPSVDSLLEITVKRVTEGIVSNYINTELKIGDIVEIIEPMGNFIYQVKDIEQTIFLWGVGSGITPLYSLIKEILYTKPSSKIILVYGNKSEGSTIFSKQLSQLQSKYDSSLNIKYFFSQENTIGDDINKIKGRISPDFVYNLVSKNTNCEESLHYICGPSGFKEIINTLTDLNIPEVSIFVEDFQLVINPKELSDVQACNATISFQGLKTDIFVPIGENILNVALDNFIELPYSCQTGNCNTCKAKLKAGQLKMLTLSKDRDDLEQDEFLLCCSYPLTKHVILEVN